MHAGARKAGEQPERAGQDTERRAEHRDGQIRSVPTRRQQADDAQDEAVAPAGKRKLEPVAGMFLLHSVCKSARTQATAQPPSARAVSTWREHLP